MTLNAAKAFAARITFRILLPVLPFLAACAIVSPLPPEVSLLSLEVTGLSLSHAALNADLLIYNPNGITVTLKEVDYVLKLNDVEVSTGRSTKKIRIGAEEYANANLRITTAYFDLWRVLKKVRKNENVEFGLKGKIKVGGLGVLNKTFNFDRQGSVPLERIEP